MHRIAATLVCLVLAGCSTASDRRVQTLEPGASATLGPGEAVSVKDTRVTVRFVAVSEDSRCPRDTTCIWAGEVKAVLEVQEASKPASQTELAEGGSMVAGGHHLTLVRVEPYPGSQARIAPQDYRATLKMGETD